MLTSDIKGILSIKIKARHDCYTDQFSRIFMPKMCIICSLVMGVDWFHDTVACMVPKASDLSSSFVHSACWIQGFYVYPTMMDRLMESNYYGIPKNMDFDGIAANGELCQTHTRQGLRNDGCEAMTKKYYVQYQYMPFFIASLAILYYFPYVIFRIVNTDIISLKSTMDKPKVDAENIVKNYFNYQVNSPSKLKIRVVMNAVIKLLYIGVNFTAFFFTNSLLLGNYKNYGINWIHWYKLNHTTAFDFFEGNTPKPGNVLLPSFGFCEIQEASMDIRNVFFNKNKFICEISPNILYQYSFIVLWFCMVLSMTVAICGCLTNLLGHAITMACFFKKAAPAKQIFKMLTLRECEYLTFIRRKNIPLYGDILRKLKRSRDDMQQINGNIDQHSPLLNGNGTLIKGSLVKRGTAPPNEDNHWSKL